MTGGEQHERVQALPPTISNTRVAFQELIPEPGSSQVVAGCQSGHGTDTRTSTRTDGLAVMTSDALQY